MKYLLFTNFFWLSLIVIGFAIFVFVIRSILKEKNKPINVLDNLAYIFIGSFFSISGLLSVISLFFYILKLDVSFFTLIIVLLFVVAVIYISYLLIRGYIKLSLDSFRVLNIANKIAVIFFILFAAFDFIFCLYCGAYLNGDAIYHSSRILDIVSSGFNIQNSFHSKLPEGGYHYNLLYALYASASELFNIEPIFVWRNSLAFFRLLSIVAIMCFISYLQPRIVKISDKFRILSIVSVTVATSLLVSRWLYISNYPNKVVSIWIMLLVMLVFTTINKKNFTRALFLSLILSLIIGMTHSLYSLITFLLLGSIVFVRFVAQPSIVSIVRDRLWLYVCFSSMLVLSVFPIISKTLPNRLSSDQMNIPFPSVNIFGLDIIDPYIYLNRLHYILLFLALLITFIYIYKKIRLERETYSILFSLVFTYLIIAFTPVSWIAQKILPLWAIDRFNVLVEISVPLVLLIVINVLFKYMDVFIDFYLKNRKEVTTRVVDFIKIHVRVLIIQIIAALCIYVGLEAYTNVWKYNYKEYRSTTSTIRQYQKQGHDYLKDNKLVIASDDLSYFLTSIFQIDILSMPYGHAALASDGRNRYDCLSHIMKTYEYQDIKFVGASFVIEKPGSGVNMNNLSYLKQVSSDTLSIYEFIPNKGSSEKEVYKSCRLYVENEKK